jgi:hypothetical protein
MKNEEVSQFRQWIAKGIMEFEERFGTPPTELVCPREAELWRPDACQPSAALAMRFPHTRRPDEA